MRLLNLLFPLIVLGAVGYFIGVLPLAKPAQTACYILLALVACLLLFPALGIPTGFPR